MCCYWLTDVAKTNFLINNLWLLFFCVYVCVPKILYFNEKKKSIELYSFITTSNKHRPEINGSTPNEISTTFVYAMKDNLF